MTGPLFRSPLTYRPFVASRLADICGVAKCPTTLCSRCGTAWCVCSWTIKDKSRGEAPHLSLRRAHFFAASCVAEGVSTDRARHLKASRSSTVRSGVVRPGQVSQGRDVTAFTRSRGRPRLVGAMPAASSARLSLRVSPPVDSRALISGGC